MANLSHAPAQTLQSHVALPKEKKCPFTKKAQRTTRQNCGLTLNFTMWLRNKK